MNKNIFNTFLFLTLVIFMVGCGEKELVIHTPQWAENSLMTNDGRLFITGGSANHFGEGYIIEVIKNDEGTFEGHEIYIDDSIVFMGIAERNGYLYINAVQASELPDKVVCILFIAKLDELHLTAKENVSNSVFTRVLIGEFNPGEMVKNIFMNSGGTQDIPVAVSNGLGIDSNGYIYIADELASRIIQCHIAADDPIHIEGIKIWLNAQADFPNGIAIKGNTLYFSELLSGNVKRVTIREGGIPGAVQTIYTRTAAILDDLTIYKDGVLVASCVDGKVFYLTDPGDSEKKGDIVFETPFETFVIPTSISIGRPPMFNDDDVIVTEGSYRPMDDGGWRVSKIKVNGLLR